MNTAHPSGRQAQAPRHLRAVLWLFAAALLLIPAVAMLFTPEVDWGPGDFAAAAILIGAAGLGVQSAVRLLRATFSRLMVIGCVLLTVLAVWAELAVGIFD
jgi:hypothetical protein